MTTKTERVEIRVDAHTLKRWKACARRYGMSLSAWIRYVLADEGTR